jgi:hypothetical protein
MAPAIPDNDDDASQVTQQILKELGRALTIEARIGNGLKVKTRPTGLRGK